MPKPMHAENPTDNAWNVIHKVLSLPGKVQGYLLNALLNTIDRAQCEIVLRESAELQKRNQNQGTKDKE